MWARDGARPRIRSPQDRHSVCLRAGDHDPSRPRAAAGDLVFDGHVAMIVGNRMVIEAGCQLGVQNDAVMSSPRAQEIAEDLDGHRALLAV
jgi:hypothetical protein